jgi:hypothetical protein
MKRKAPTLRLRIEDILIMLVRGIGLLAAITSTDMDIITTDTRTTRATDIPTLEVMTVPVDD